MPAPPVAPEMLELDPESTGLTNIVSGRLAIFEAKPTATPADDTHSCQPTPCKVTSRPYPMPPRPVPACPLGAPSSGSPALDFQDVAADPGFCASVC